MSRPAGYDVGSYGSMVAPGPRMEAYRRALEAHVRPGSIVVDLGAGTGAMALLACRLGAARVHAIEPDDAIHFARRAAAANGFADRIVFHPALSSQVTLDEKAHVVVSDLRGTLPLFQHHIATLTDARERLLAPGGVLIPLRDTLWAVPVESHGEYRPFEEPWLRNDLGLDLRAGREQVVNRWQRVRNAESTPLAAPARWAELDYRVIREPDVEGSATWRSHRRGTLHGFLVWFDAQLADGIGFSNAPEAPELIYSRAFFPLESPVAVEEGDAIALRISARLMGEDYAWGWDTRVWSGPGDVEGGPPRATLRQSTLLGAPLTPERLRRREASFVPRLTPAGEADAFILAGMDGRATLETIARAAAQRFPALFPRWEDALARVGELAERNAR